MPDTRDLLIEVGTEELPPKALKRLSEAFGEQLCAGLAGAGLKHGKVTLYATPRRLAVLIADLPESQPERQTERRGPALSAAFDANGNPTKAALGFARSCGVPLENLDRLETNKGDRLIFRHTESGQTTLSLLPTLIEEALAKLPIPKPMRWADLEVEFVRPVHWVVLLFGDEIVEARILGVDTCGETRGHRFHHPGALPIPEPARYAALLYETGHVVADFPTRREMIRKQVKDSATALGGRAIIDEALLEEVTALVEWPVACVGSFDEEFLKLPAQALIGTMKGNQKYFHVVDEAGRLMPHFIAVSNIESRNPEAVRRGNERVIRPRLSDCAFFYKTDLQTTLENRLEDLKGVIFQDKLGSLYDKSQRVSKLAAHIAIAMGETPNSVALARRAGLLCKCDLLTDMVSELPELQGYMGREYASHSGEPEAVAVALEEAYMPRFSGDGIPATSTGRAVAIADKLDILEGIFGIGEIPSGDKDPFALRRAALGILRIIIEGELDLALPPLLKAAAEGYGQLFDWNTVVARTFDFMIERLRAYFLDQGVPAEVFAAVLARQPTRPFDFARRIHAVDQFRKMPEATSLAAANKRIQNILKQVDEALPDKVDDTLFAEDAEWNLADRLVGLSPRVKELLRSGDYTAAMKHLAGLRDTVDAFFEGVLVMADDEAVKKNRLALLNNISSLFLETADISLLHT